ncbi:MAG: propionyl-CoA--succinate CoA transferase, partial [Campylobacter lanienae]|nr:propionyl-CoA--succinate CoA transferase [Campylobacter lanienae]
MIDNTINDTSRIKDARYLSKVIKADEAAALIPHKAQIGFSGFVGAGSPLYVPIAIANRAQKLHEAGQEYKISIYSGASTDVDLDGVLAKANCVEFRTPFNT